jgi:two-component system cell cycle sensor histidine kinase/response regulator CckA
MQPRARDKKGIAGFFLFIVLMIAYSISIVVLTMLDEADRYATLGLYFCFAGTAVGFVLWWFMRCTGYEYQLDVLRSRYHETLLMDAKAILIIDEHIVCREVLLAKKVHKIANYPLSQCLDVLGITKSSLEIIECFANNQTLPKDHRTDFCSIKSDVLYIYQEHNLMELVLYKAQEEERYILKVRYAAMENSRLMQLMPIGYFEVDQNGAIYKVNRQFASYLGYNIPESIIENKVLFHKLIVSRSGGGEAFDEKLYHMFNQEIISIKTQRGEVETFLLILCPQLHDRPGAFGFLTRLRQKEIDYFSDHLEKYWIDYSWKCFFEDSPYPVCIANPSGVISKANAAYKNQVCDNPEASLIDLFNDEDAKLLKQKMHSIASGIPDSQTLPTVQHKDSSKIFELFLGKILNLDGKFHAFMVRVTDVTQRKHLEENLSHAQRMQTIGQLVGSVAHDFNNILTAISGFCDLLLLSHRVGDPSFANIMQIKQSADRASSLIQRLLAFSRKQTLQMQRANPLDIFSDFNPIIQRLIGTQMHFTQKIEPDSWDIQVDLVQFEQVILNLVVNAQQAMQQDGRLEIYVKNIEVSDVGRQFAEYHMPPGEKYPDDAGQYVEIVVQDNGCGIDALKIPRIFEPFYTTKSHISGTGLGLSTVYGVIKQCGGYLMIKSQVGVGTEFKILLPRCLQALNPIPRTSEVNESNNNMKIMLPGNATIVLVEDEDAIRIFVKNVLITKGYKVYDFSSAEQVIQELTAAYMNFDLLITDVVMPEMSGPKLVDKLREKYPECKVIFISGYAEDAFSQEYGQQRNFNFLPKPFSLKQLVLKVQEVLAKG